MTLKFGLKSVGAAALGLGLAACNNILKEFATTNSNDAYLYDARAAMNDRDYDRAITKLAALTPDYQARRDVIVTTAGAYAGRCGLDFLSVVRTIIDQPSANLFKLLLQNFKTATTGSVADCATAETWMRKLAPSNDFTSLEPGDAMFLAVAALANIGATLGTYADLNHDGTPDPSFDACNTTKFPDARARAVAVSLNLALAGVQASNSTAISGSVAGVAAACAALPVGANFCGTYDAATFTTMQIQVLNGLVHSQDSPGLGTCANTLANCVCH